MLITYYRHKWEVPYKFSFSFATSWRENIETFPSFSRENLVWGETSAITPPPSPTTSKSSCCLSPSSVPFIFWQTKHPWALRVQPADAAGANLGKSSFWSFVGRHCMAVEEHSSCFIAAVIWANERQSRLAGFELKKAQEIMLATQGILHSWAPAGELGTFAFLPGHLATDIHEEGITES